MRYFGFLICLLLLASCTNDVQIKNSEIEKPAMEIKTTKVQENGEVQAVKNPELKITSPKDIELIKDSKVIVRLEAENFRIVPIESSVRNGEGHFHVWLDSEKRVTADKIITFENIASGKHTIVAELVRSNHSSLDSKVIKTITVNVESNYTPPQQVQQQGVSEFAVEADDSGFYPGTLKAKIGDKVRISFKFKDDSIYFAGLDVRGPFEDIQYRLKGEQPIAREFTMKDETRITSWWPSSGVKKATLTVEIEK